MNIKFNSLLIIIWIEVNKFMLVYKLSAVKRIDYNVFLVIYFALLIFASESWPKQQVHYSHGLSRFDELKYSAKFSHFDYVNPEAPKGGEIRLFVHGTFDSLNPYSIHGITPSQAPNFHYMRYGFNEFNEPLMVGSGHYSPSGDEIKTAYGLIAKSIEYPEDNSRIIFNLRSEARFHDGHPITADDVIFSFNQLRIKGHPRYKMQLESIVSVEKLNDYKVRFTFKSSGTRIQLFQAAELPVLPAHYWKDKPIDQTTLLPPLQSGPYRIVDVQAGRLITFQRQNDYWGKDLPVNKGRYNFDRVTLYFHRDLQVALESFKAGGHDVHLEIVAKNWETAYDFPAIQSGKVKMGKIYHKMAYGSSFFFFNTRRDIFSDIRVRQALTLLFDFEWTNRVIFHNTYKRSLSYFPNSDAVASVLPSQQEQKLMAPWRHIMSSNIFEKNFTLPITNGSGDLRIQQQKALRLLHAAGWTLKNKKLMNSSGKAFKFQFLNESYATSRYILPWKKKLATIGVDLEYLQVDASQYIYKIRSMNFDMIEQVLPQTLAPDKELENYFHSSQSSAEGSRNFAGIINPAIDNIISRIIISKTREEMLLLTRSLDRILLWNYYGIPKWYCDFMRVAYRDVFAWPERQASYTTPFSTWWRKDIHHPVRK